MSLSEVTMTVEGDCIRLSIGTIEVTVRSTDQDPDYTMRMLKRILVLSQAYAFIESAEQKKMELAWIGRDIAGDS